MKFKKKLQNLIITVLKQFEETFKATKCVFLIKKLSYVYLFFSVKA